MISQRWLEKRKPHWTRLAELAKKSGSRGVTALKHAELQELGLLYRQAASDLATVREEPAHQLLAQYLNQLLARAHNLIYMGKKSGTALGLVHFYSQTYPRIFRDHLQHTVVAFSIFLACAVAAFLISLRDPSFVRFLLNGPMTDTIERQQMWTHSVLTVQPLASSAIMTNNLSVAFVTFAMGITAGIGTIWMMAMNGVLMGVIGAACWQAGMSLQLWSFVAPHGVLELPAIFIAGGAGLRLAQAWLFPGLLPRRDSLARGGGEAVHLLLGTIPLLMVAGVIEAFLSPTNLPVSVKFLFAGALFALLIAYLSMNRQAARS